MPRATLAYHDKLVYPDGGIVEMTIWRLPGHEPQRPHRLKYSLYYGKGGRRIVAYDNERGKGNHRHYGNRETPYRFESVERLIADFLADVEKTRSRP
ncbi:MAG: toxin-antitoxin system TumE family protein [Nevskiales bacterium]